MEDCVGVFPAYCAACHPDGGNAVNLERSLQQAAFKSFLVSSNSDHEARIVAQVTNNAGLMPSCRDLLPPSDISEITASYVEWISSKA